MMMLVQKCRKALALLLIASAVMAQDYAQDYPEYTDYADSYGSQDNLYHDYAQKHAEKGGGGMGKAVLFSAAAWFLGGKIHTGRAMKKLKTKFQKEQKALYTQYYNDVYKLTEQNNDLTYLVEQYKVALAETEQKAELDALQRDYEEFKQPDIDGDDRISRAEFNMYVKNYLSNYPGLAEKDYPKFEDFDHDGDGYVGFKEYAEQMALQVQQAEKEQYKAKQAGQAPNKKVEALQGMYKKTTTKGQSFEDMYAAYR